MSRVKSTAKRHAGIAAEYQTKIVKSYHKRLGYYENRLAPEVDTDTKGAKVETVVGTTGYNTRSMQHFKVRGKERIYRESKPLIKTF